MNSWDDVFGMLKEVYQSQCNAKDNAHHEIILKAAKILSAIRAFGSEPPSRILYCGNNGMQFIWANGKGAVTVDLVLG